MSKNKKKQKQTNNDKPIVKFYKENYKKFLILPILLFIFGLIMIVNTIQKDGAPIYRDVSLKGGLSAILEVTSSTTDEQLLSNLQSNFPNNEFTVSILEEKKNPVGFVIETDLEDENLIPYLETTFNIKIEQGNNYMSNYISPTLSNAFFSQAMYVLLISFILMSSVIFLYFRKLVPSGAVVLSAIFDIVVTVGFLDLIGFKISIAGIGALLMLIGYSIDTDVLLTNRLIKEKGTNYFEKVFLAFKTGTLMSFTTLMAGLVALILTNSTIIKEIALILVIGLLVDFVSTWIQNSSILLWWLERKEN